MTTRTIRDKIHVKFRLEVRSCHALGHEDRTLWLGDQFSKNPSVGGCKIKLNLSKSLSKVGVLCSLSRGGFHHGSCYTRHLTLSGSGGSKTWLWLPHSQYNWNWIWIGPGFWFGKCLGLRFSDSRISRITCSVAWPALVLPFSSLVDFYILFRYKFLTNRIWKLWHEF